MLVYNNVISKKGHKIYALYYQFASGKIYRLVGIPYSIVKAIVSSDKIYTPCIDEENK